MSSCDLLGPLDRKLKTRFPHIENPLKLLAAMLAESHGEIRDVRVKLAARYPKLKNPEFLAVAILAQPEIKTWELAEWMGHHDAIARDPVLIP